MRALPVEAEVERTLAWDNCEQPLAANEPYAVTTVQTGFGKVFYIACVLCGSGRHPNIRAKCNDFLALHRAGLTDPEWPRLASNEAAEIIEQLMESEIAPGKDLAGRIVN